jgi:hypothetical protein
MVVDGSLKKFQEATQKNFIEIGLRIKTMNRDSNSSKSSNMQNMGIWAPFRK